MTAEPAGSKDDDNFIGPWESFKSEVIVFVTLPLLPPWYLGICTLLTPPLSRA